MAHPCAGNPNTIMMSMIMGMIMIHRMKRKKKDKEKGKENIMQAPKKNKGKSLSLSWSSLDRACVCERAAKKHPRTSFRASDCPKRALDLFCNLMTVFSCVAACVGVSVANGHLISPFLSAR
ncbi:hypothetical protein EJ05DRAFT_95635 [Pseudovirgaria hyperparasitica]|uniref:Uncharacterized protein n=1 Tax=Pseudovirgaria hyperparasitica TaxID=470096 RepID=A0A6A6W2B3_9PEZI|nr:uncharacterized protein EJ05DRAFT_95635 [Pseudovirgaria hyperparasitica]KAF2756259.1 hypothetical protein EJ05DRAFT_95635 [Pseudovirgaria hyperparasitica]